MLIPLTDKAVRRDKLVEALSTLRGAVRLYVLSGYTIGFVIVGVIAAGRGVAEGWMEPFMYGKTWVPGYTGTGGTNLSVAIYAAFGLVARAVFIVIRWYQLRWIIEEFRKRGAYDVDGDGRTDTFADKFLDDL